MDRGINQPLLEGCVDSYASAAAAAAGGADRLELCANLAIGGTTPSPFLFEQVHRDFDLPVNILIRPRFGDFLYDRNEVEEMARSVRMFRDLGANGVVIGCLAPDGVLDQDKIRALMAQAGDMEVTLHRAFDMTRDPLEALETAVSLGFSTILTSGQAQNALVGKGTLRQVFQRSAGRIDIMAGSGVKKENIREIYDYTGIRVFHTTGRGAAVDSGMRYRKESVSMGLPSLSEYELWRTDERELRACAELVHSLGQ